LKHRNLVKNARFIGFAVRRIWSYHCVMDYKNLKKSDLKIYELVKKEEKRQREGLELIPSENYASSAVLEASGSIFNDKYAENYPGKRYYGGCINADELEKLCQERALKVFEAEDYHVNVQPYSGSPANLEVYFALLEPGEKIMSLRLDQGGHLTHGSPVNLSGRMFKFVHYGLDPQKEVINYDGLVKLADLEKPKLILSGFTAYPRKIDFKKIHEIAKSVGAISMADISHISGLIIGGVHPSPFPFTDVVTTTTHKTLRGPRGAMIFSRRASASQSLAEVHRSEGGAVSVSERIDRMVFPGMQGGPHEHTIAGIAVALKEASRPDFRTYAKQVVKNAKVLAEELQQADLKLVSGGTDTHLMVINLLPFGSGRGVFIEKALEAANISVNKSAVPNDPSPPFYPSGIRLGTPPVTSRGMKEKEMKKIAGFLFPIIKEFAKTELPQEREKRADFVKKFKEMISGNPLIKKVRMEVKSFSSKFPVPGTNRRD
jgi:glycine hydroxymethyltransferase